MYTAEKTETIIKGIIGSGVRSMPAFQIPDDEFTKLLEFLKTKLMPAEMQITETIMYYQTE